MKERYNCIYWERVILKQKAKKQNEKKKNKKKLARLLTIFNNGLNVELIESRKWEKMGEEKCAKPMKIPTLIVFVVRLIEEV